MDKKQVNRSCVTNMKEKDPIIKKYMKDYMNTVEEYDHGLGDEQLIVNFDITYPDGRCENFTCNGVSNVFGPKDCCDDQKDKIKCKKEQKPKIYNDCENYNEKVEYKNCNKKMNNNDFCDYENFSNDDFYDSNYFKNKHSDFFEDYEKSLNYENMCNSFDMNQKKYVKADKDDLYQECEKLSQLNNCSDDNKSDKPKKQCKKITGKIIVYSFLRGCDDVELKGVPINLYKVNGVCPELIECEKTDCNGKVCFDNLPEGCYRVIELINKKYFAKPTYINWNEVNINKDNVCSTIYIINKMK